MKVEITVERGTPDVAGYCAKVVTGEIPDTMSLASQECYQVYLRHMLLALRFDAVETAAAAQQQGNA